MSNDNLVNSYKIDYSYLFLDDIEKINKYVGKVLNLLFYLQYNLKND